MSGDLLGGIKILGVFGLVLWFAWRQAKGMERARAKDARRAAEAPPPED